MDLELTRTRATPMRRALLALAMALPLTCAAQYPAKPIRIISPYPPGGRSEEHTSELQSH